MDLDDLIKGLEKEINEIPENKAQEQDQKISKMQPQKIQDQQQQKNPQPFKPKQTQQIDIQQQQPQQKGTQIQPNQAQSKLQQPQQQPQQQLQIQPKQQSQQLNSQSIIEKEMKYTKPPSFKSLTLLQQEQLFILNSCLKSQAIQNNPQAQSFYQNLFKQFEQQKKQLIDFVETGKLRAEIYGKFIFETMKDQSVLFEQAQTQGDQFYVQRIGKRMNLLKVEMGLVKSNPQQGFQEIVKKISPNTEIPQQEGRAAQKVQARQEQTFQKNNYSNFNSEKAIEANIDSQKDHVKFESLLKRYKVYYNLVNYFLLYVKERRKDDIKEILALLEKGKAFRVEFNQGKNPNIGSFLMNELKELTLERFHAMNHQQYKNEHQRIFNLLLDANNREREFQKIALHSKRIQIGKNQTYNPHEESKQRLFQYGEAFDHLKILQKMQWILLPELEVQNLDVPICIENKDIPPKIFRIKFKKLNNCKYEKYFLTFSFDTNAGIISKQTDFCDKTCSFNADFDIPIESNIDYSQKSVEVRLFEKGFFGSTEIGVGQFSLEGIKAKTLFDGVTKIQNPKKQDIELSFSLQIREPLDKYTVLKIEFVKLAMKCSQFNPEEGLKEYLDQEMVKLPTYEEYKKQQELKRLQEIEEEKQRQMLLEQKVQEEEELIKQQPNKIQSSEIVFLNHMDNDPAIIAIKNFLSTNPQLPPELVPNDILYPENPAKFPVSSFIMQYEPLANSKSVELKQEPSLRQWARFVQNMWEDYARQKAIIGRKLEQEDVDWFLGRIQNLLPLENFLLETYTSLNLQQWVQFIKFRKSKLEQDLAELYEVLGKE